MRASHEPPACVFCGRPILPDEPVTGRPPIAAHSACADAALADDSHWEAIAGADENTPPGTRG